MLSPLFRRVVVAAVAIGLAPAVRAEEPKAADLRSRMQAFVDQGELAGAVTVVGRKSGVVSHEAFGKLRLDGDAPMPKDAIFRIASMTKPITAIGVMMLAEEGKLSVDDPVEKHLPEFRGQMLVAERKEGTVTLKKSPRPITLRDLLTHTSGLPGGPPVGLSDLYAKRNHTLAEGVMAFSQMPLTFEPGSKWSYCNTGIDTLGRVIEVASGMSYEGFLLSRVFEPLGMNDTTFNLTAAQLARVPPIYNRINGRLVVESKTIIGPPPGEPPMQNRPYLVWNIQQFSIARYPIPAGGLYSTGPDLAKLYTAMLNGGALGKTQILSAKSVAEMTKVHTGELQAGFTPGMGWGLGWGVVKEPKGVTAMLSPGTFGHGGAFGTQGWIDPKQDLFVVLLIQRVGIPNSDASKMRQELQAAVVEMVRK
ncbi:MAG: serine hydrolase domain-containing protein [Gemmataceae bacterium]